MSNDQERIIEIETKLAYQEDTIQQLNQALYQQQKQINDLETTCKFLVDRFKSLSENAPSNIEAVDEKPPHY